MAKMQKLLIAVVAAIAMVIASGPLTPSTQAQQADLISSTGVGNAIVGSTLAQLKAQLGPQYTFEEAGQILVDVKGYNVIRDGRVIFVAAAAVGTGDLTPNEPLDVFLVEPGAVTAEGIGPDSTIDDAVAAYGAVTLSFSPDNESREFANFENQPDRLFFRTGSGPVAGIYADGETETTTYRDGATISSVWVTCGRECPAIPTLPNTGTSHVVLTAIALTSIGAGIGVLFGARRRFDRISPSAG